MDLTVELVDAIERVDASAWDALDHGPSPFTEHGFLWALEASESVGPGTGWEPIYVTVRGRRGAGTAQPRASGAEPQLLGAVAAYFKDHSYGEYIFDFQWAHAAQRNGLRYYPKLVVAAPMTPATGRRLLLHPELDDAERGEVIDALCAVVQEVAREAGCSSVHWLFCSEQEQQALARRAFFPRASFQFHFHNPGYPDFDAFLATLSSRKRKQVRKERARAQASFDALEFVPGAALDAGDLRAMDRYYRATVRDHGSTAYLRPGFFEALVERMPQRVRFCRVQCDREPFAGALYLQTPQALYGRYWGCDRHVPFVHFEVAYYAGIEHCIREGIPLFEAGAQGEHKLLRGFAPAPTYSNHFIAHPGLRAAVEAFLREEADSLDPHMESLAEYLPYRCEDGEAQ